MTQSTAPGATANVVDGHVIERTSPSTTFTSGRTSVKSKNSSGSMSQNAVAFQARASRSIADDAASPASFQPSNAPISTGRSTPSCSGRPSERSRRGSDRNRKGWRLSWLSLSNCTRSPLALPSLTAGGLVQGCSAPSRYAPCMLPTEIAIEEITDPTAADHAAVSDLLAHLSQREVARCSPVRIDRSLFCDGAFVRPGRRSDRRHAFARHFLFAHRHTHRGSKMLSSRPIRVGEASRRRSSMRRCGAPGDLAVVLST